MCGFCFPLRAGKLSIDNRLAIERSLTAEYATLKVVLPQAKRALVIHPDGSFDQQAWADKVIDNGPCAHVGDEVQITRVLFKPKKIVFEINGGTHHGHWYDHVEVGMGGAMSPVSTDQNGGRPQGSRVALVFPHGVPPLKSAEIRHMLSGVFDFSKHSASELYFDRLPAPVQKAIKEKRAIKGMNHDEVVMALGKPQDKSRQTNSKGDEIESWVYGTPPGKLVFVTFDEGKVTQVKESYAYLGGRTSPPLPPVIR
ncbi:MAG TPA: hypothetical protein VF283_13365 [Bryobacteraceae bacterium]